MEKSILGAPEDRSRYRESAVHGTPKFPMRVYANDFSWYAGHVIDWHWHPEIEIAVVLSGRVRCHISDMVIEVGEGEGFFINSNTMHMETPIEGQPEPIMTTVVFMPEFIGDCGEDLIYKRYIRPMTADTAIRGFKLSGQIPWQEEILSRVRELFGLAQDRSWGYELLLRNMIGQIWYTLAVNLRIGQSEALPQSSGLAESRIKEMLSFIHENYGSDITVEDIAAAANISKSECFRCFRSTISKKPIEYLNEYRLKKASELLISGDMPVTEICLACGFNHISYFGKMFRQQYGMTPRQFRTEAAPLRQRENSTN